MRFLVIPCAMVASIGVSASTLAQNDAVPAPPSVPTVDMPTTTGQVIKVPQAPIGHRQPKAKDLPADVDEATTAPTPQDKEVDQKLRICRGC
jgi:hypothetical protein